MNEHEAIRTMLPLAAAGVLAQDELSTVEQHAITCFRCRRELEVLRLYSRGLRELSQPTVPAGLLQRTSVRVVQEHAMAADRRWRDLMLGLLALFSWTIGVVFWMLVRTVTSGVWKVLGTNLADPVTWFVVSALLVWTTAGVAVVILAQCNVLVRRVL